MALSKEDMQQIREVIIEGVEAVTGPRFDALESDVAELKSDVVELKSDVAELKSDVVELKSDVAELKSDVVELKSDVIGLKTDMAEVMGSVRVLNMSMDELSGRVEALENDIKEIYIMLANQTQITDKKFAKFSLEEKLLKLNAELISTAKQAGIVLPR
jgi:chromosome segregation ATPase